MTVVVIRGNDKDKMKNNINKNNNNDDYDYDDDDDNNNNSFLTATRPFSVTWQHVTLSQQVRPSDTPACCWDVKQASKQPTCMERKPCKEAR